MIRSATTRPIRTWAIRTWVACLAFSVLKLLAAPDAAHALKPIVVSPDQERIEITTLGEFYEGRGDSLQIETATGTEGLSGRMSVRAATLGTNPSWVVFALSNPTDRPIERWLTADRYTIVGSGIVWPDLDARRIEAVTPSQGFVPERVRSDRADVFRITLEAGQTITYVAELSSERFARVYLWKPLDYELKVRERQLFNGIMLGLTGLLAVFLTSIFAANHKIIFPAAALVSWCVLAHLCVDFGFFHKLFQLRPDDNAVYRAATEASMAASIVIFLHTFLRLHLGHGLLKMLLGVWIIAQLALVAVAVVDPRLAATFARVSFGAIGGVGMLFILFLALRGQDRALSLIPTWLLFLVWIFAAGVILTGRLSAELAVSALIAGLVLLVVLIGFTVTQYAFRNVGPAYGAAPNELQTRAMALESAGASIWEWNGRRDEVKFSAELERSLGLNPGELSTRVDDFLRHVHTGDAERFRQTLWSIQERAGGRIRAAFRLRHADNSYRWVELEGAALPSSDRRAVKCIGLVRDVTEARRAQERMMHDAVNCSLTGLPNRELFLDRAGVAVARAKTEAEIRPTVLLIDMDKFRSANSSFGLLVGDSLLLTAARRLQRHLDPQDTLARVGGDQFAILFLKEQDPAQFASLAERIRRSLRSPIKIAGQEVVLTGSLGIAVYDGEQANGHDLFKEAEMAMLRAKRGGSDRIEIFRPEMRGEVDDRVEIESDLRRAIEKGQLSVLYQPIIYLPTEELAGFEALVRWSHPKKGMINPAAFVPVAEESDLIVKLGSFVLARAAADIQRWQRELPRTERPLFVSVNVSAKQLFRQDLVGEIRSIIGRQTLAKGSLKLEVTESLVMENPEQATEILEHLRGTGVELALDDFGTGYSSLAYLQKFPFDTIKIDRALVQSSRNGDGSGLVIVRSLVAMVHELGRKVVAEGVEQPDDATQLRAMGCEYAQGFYYGEPMPEKEVQQLLRMVKKAERSMQPGSMFRRKSRKSQPPKADEASASASAAPTPPGDGGGSGGGPNGSGPGGPGGGPSGTKPGKGKKGARPGTPGLGPAPFKTRSRPATPGVGGPPVPPGHPGAPNGAYVNGTPAVPPSPTQPPAAAPFDAFQIPTAPPLPPHAVPPPAQPPPAPPMAQAMPPPVQPGPPPYTNGATVPPLPPAASPPPVTLPQPQPAQAPPHAATNGHPQHRPMATGSNVRPLPDLSTLPPGIAASLARLAGAPVKKPPVNDGN